MGQEVLFYDGSCGLCDRTVQLVIKRDRAGRFRCAPLGGERYRREVQPQLSGDPPDAIAVVTDTGELLWRTDALLYLLARMDRPWPAVARWLCWIPRTIRDWGYRKVARVRRSLFAPPACPVATLGNCKRFDP